MRTFSLLVSLLLLVVSTSAIEIKVVSVTAEDGAKPIDPASIKLVPRPLSPSSIERVRNKTVEDGDPAHAGRRSATPANAVSYSGNWCGAMQNAPASNLVSSVSGWLTAPILDIRHTENRTPQFAASWMGIDGGENCRTALLQGGTTTEVCLLSFFMAIFVECKAAKTLTMRQLCRSMPMVSRLPRLGSSGSQMRLTTFPTCLVSSSLVHGIFVDKYN